MQARSISIDLPKAPSTPKHAFSGEAVNSEQNLKAPGLYRVIRRNGEVTGFDPNKIRIAITKAFLAVEGSNAAASTRLAATIGLAATNVIDKLNRRKPDGGTFHIEEIQDQVELCLVRAGHYQVARAYMLYREARAKERAAGIAKTIDHLPSSPGPKVKQADSGQASRSVQRLRKIVAEACTDLEHINPEILSNDAAKAC